MWLLWLQAVTRFTAISEIFRTDETIEDFDYPVITRCLSKCRRSAAKLDSLSTMWIMGLYRDFGTEKTTRPATANKRNVMWDYLSSSTAQGIIWLAVALILSLVGWHFVTGWRDRNSSVDADVDVLSNFREMREQGVLDDDEFRTIKSNMSGQSRQRK